ncbi:bifunctional serine/threonine-protein kinase/ABC transporter substrate-binding protein [Streptomyces sp. NPDC091377]|uniref:bifunctional serine/threonine-protein kinase/ABC transporter substrate-binding protein n=1 Tax=Streptomyces sp. NPDC091377 TaxID=3365995 RepID=UPI00381EEA6F
MEPLLPSDPSWLGAYRLLGRLGAGGMGVVYVARAVNGDLAAVKVIQPEYAEEHEFRARFRREVATARQVRSPWVVPVLGADTETASPWLATAFVPGPALAEAVLACGPLPSRAVRVLGKVLARALAAVHAAGLVHRDVKPGNVLLAMDGPRLIDFGIARSTAAEATELTSAGMMVGTPGFLSPEQARAHEVGAPSDVFSLACVLAYAATGRPPFGTGAVDALLYRTVHDAPELTGVQDEALRELLGRCLAKDPAGRPTAVEVDRALVEDAPEGSVDWLPDPMVLLIAQRSEAMLALPGIEPTLVPGQPAPPQPRPGRRRFLTLAAGGAALLAAGGGTALWAALRDDGEQSPQATGERRVIGLHADLSGPQKALGRAQERAARLAVAQFNAARTKPFTLVLDVMDDRGEPARAESAARRLSGMDEVLAVVGPTGFVSAEASVAVYEGARMPVVTVSELSLAATQSVLLSLPKSYFRGAAMAPYTAFGTAVALAGQEIGRAGLLIDRAGGISGYEMTSMVKGSAANQSLELYTRVVPETEDPSAVIDDMLDHDIEGLYYTGTPERAARVARTVAGRGFRGPLFLDPGSARQEFITAAGEAAEDWYCLSSHIDPQDARVKAFTTAYTERYDEAPGTTGPEAYDVVRLLANRLAALGDGGREELTASLATSRYQGLTARYVFDDNHFLDVSQVHRYRVVGDRFDYLGPLDLFADGS